MQKHSFWQLFLTGVKRGSLLRKNNVSKQAAHKIHRLRRMKERVINVSEQCVAYTGHLLFLGHRTEGHDRKNRKSLKV
jgi:hypothetical protein